MKGVYIVRKSGHKDSEGHPMFSFRTSTGCGRLMPKAEMQKTVNRMRSEGLIVNSSALVNREEEAEDEH